MKSLSIIFAGFVALSSMGVMANSDDTQILLLNEQGVAQYFSLSDIASSVANIMSNVTSTVVSGVGEIFQDAVGLGGNLFKKGTKLFLKIGSELVELTRDLAEKYVPANDMKAITDFERALATGDDKLACQAAKEITAILYQPAWAIVGMIISVPGIVKSLVNMIGPDAAQYSCQALAQLMYKLNAL